LWTIEKKNVIGKADILAKVILYPTAQGGRGGATPGDKFGCLCVVNGATFDCRLLLAQSLEHMLGFSLPMQKAVEAIYEDGVLKPLEKLDLEEGKHFTLLLFEAVREQPQKGYRHLVARTPSRRRQLYLKGRNLTVGQLVYSMRADHLLPEQAAEQYDLPLEAIQEALGYYQAHREVIDAEAAAEKRYLQDKGYMLEPEDLP
jgi:predicted DNA-binding antitoxin AbrB/MazE fold protein